MIRSIPLLTLALAACVPNNAELTSGRYEAYLANTTSRTVFEGKVKIDEAPESYIIDCRDLDDESQRLFGYNPDLCTNFRHEGWLEVDGYRVMAGPIEPWRGEAVITSEGDFQVTFHHRLPGGENMRFAFVLDPNFRPQRCAEDGSGNTVAEDIDGDWLTEWSADVDSGTLYYLNAGAFQFDPGETTTVWTLPQEWRAGYAIARFSAEELFMRRPRYGEPSAYASYELDEFVSPPATSLFYSGMREGDDPTQPGGVHQRMINRAETISDQVNEEFAAIGSDAFTRIHTNEWRLPDNSPAGLDSWVELHYSWVRIDAGSDMSPGGNASGDFQIVFDAGESQSRLVVNGSFQVDRIKRDRWVTDDIAGVKLDQAGTQLCVPNE